MSTNKKRDLTAYRKEHGLQGKDVAEILGYSPGYISRCENGRDYLSEVAWRLLELEVTRREGKARLYFELHITVEENGPFNLFTETAENHLDKWRTSRFSEDHVDDYHGKWFMSARFAQLDEAKADVKDAIAVLEGFGYTVLRWKIEDTLLDSKYGDVL